MTRNVEINFSRDFRENSTKLDQVEKVIKAAESDCQKFRPMNFDLSVEITWNDSEFVNENMRGVHGRTLNPKSMEFELNTDAEHWQKFLKSQYMHEYGHTVFMKPLNLKYETNIKNWRHILLEAHGQHFSEKIFPQFEADWRTEHSRRDIAEDWKTYRSLMSKKIDQHSIFNYEKYPPWLGYSLSYRIGKELTKNHELKEFPKLEKEDVIQAGNKLFVDSS